MLEIEPLKSVEHVFLQSVMPAEMLLHSWLMHISNDGVDVECRCLQMLPEELRWVKGAHGYFEYTISNTVVSPLVKYFFLNHWQQYHRIMSTFLLCVGDLCIPPIHGTFCLARQRCAQPSMLQRSIRRVLAKAQPWGGREDTMSISQYFLEDLGHCMCVQ